MSGESLDRGIEDRPVPRRGLGGRIRGAVFVLSLLCLGWVLWPIWRHARELGQSVEGARLAGWVVAGVVAYTVLNVLVAVAWWWVAGIYGARPPLRVGYVVWARSQLAKYLPGNVFHFVSRQVLGRATGLSHPALIASSFLEIGGQLFAALVTGAAVFAVAGAATRPAGAGAGFALSSVLGLAVACLVAWPVCDAVLRRLPRTAGWMAGLPRLSVVQTLRLLGPAVGLHALFFLATGALLLALSAAAGGPSVEPWRILGLFPFAWMAGIVAVGAPAGVGVREAVLTLGLEPILGAAPAAVIALALRLVTLGGDLLTALAGWWLSER